jgi:hypothetical protein
MRTARFTTAGLLVAAAATAPAQAPVHAHGASPALGTVHFATSCRPAVAPRFDRAVALLHSFEFGASIRTFNEVLAEDSTCAMAHWGIALSRWTNPMAVGIRPPALLRQGQASIDAATRLAARATPRERAYIAAVGRLYGSEQRDQRTRILEYEQAMRALVAAQPADTEAKIFHAIALVAAAEPTDKTFANQLEAGRVLEALWAKQPDHPGLAHYIIHAYDYPPLAARAREAARRYATIAPDAAHALHMPSHTFTRVGMWTESIDANRRSMAAALQEGAVAEALHAADYAMYAHLQAGNVTAAKELLDQLPVLAARRAGSHPGALDARAGGMDGGRGAGAEAERLSLYRRDDVLRPRTRRGSPA